MKIRPKRAKARELLERGETLRLLSNHTVKVAGDQVRYWLNSDTHPNREYRVYRDRGGSIESISDCIEYLLDNHAVYVEKGVTYD